MSDSLVRVYFLDGSFKTVFYDESTHTAEVAAKICFSVKIALFEVHKDIKNPEEYKLIPTDECIANIIARWGVNGLNHAKLVIPIYDVNSSLKTQAPISMSRAASGTARASMGSSVSTSEHLAEKKIEKEVSCIYVLSIFVF